MDLILFGVFMAIAFILIGYGLRFPEHTELSLIGFVFLFLLSMLIINNQLTFIIGTNTTSTFTYGAVGNNTFLTNSFEENLNIYGETSMGGALSHTLGYWLAVGSIIGFIGVLLGLKNSGGFK